MTDEKANAPSADEPPSHLPPATETSDISPPASDSIATEPDHKSSAAPSRTIWRRVYAIITYTPQRCRHDPTQPPRFSMPLNLLFGFAGTFTVANLYYNHPILNKLAESFGVTNEQVSIVPTLMQAGYASGLLFLCPLGDIFRRRTFVLVLVWFTATVWYGVPLREAYASGSAALCC